MILLGFVLIPLIGGLLAWLTGRWSDKAARWVALSALVLNLFLALALWFQHFRAVQISSQGQWLAEVNIPWLPLLGSRLHLAIDGLSLILIILTACLGIVAVLSSWTEIDKQVGLFHFQLMWVIAGISGVFLSLDLFLFYFFWELMLVPMYFLIILWGHEKRNYAAVKFFLFTQLSGLLMLLAILGLYFAHAQATGIYTFDYLQLLGTKLAPITAFWLMLGFLIAFAVKLPVVPFHTWLPDAHTEAPTAGSIILAGLLLKTGAYGLIRFVVPLFPSASSQFAPVGMALAVIGIIYGALVAFAQTDLKRMVAYTSISHMGFVFLGLYAWNTMALQGVVMQMICHGLSTGALFLIVGALQERIHTRDIRKMGGFWSQMPWMGASALFFTLAALALPGLGNFVGEFLVLNGTFQGYPLAAIIATFGLVASTIYSLWMMQRVFHGQPLEAAHLPDFTSRERLAVGFLIALTLWLGLFPQPVINTAQQTLDHLQQYLPISRSPNGQGSLKRQEIIQEVAYDVTRPDLFIALPNPRFNPRPQSDDGFSPAPSFEDGRLYDHWVRAGIPFAPA